MPTRIRNQKRCIDHKRVQGNRN